MFCSFSLRRSGFVHKVTGGRCLLSLRELLQRDEAVLRHLLQQELKKTESLKAAEAKVAKLREQLQASERIVSANKMLLRKLCEQVRPLSPHFDLCCLHKLQQVC